ncbi:MULTISPECIES: lysophospholipid acyltransferase family protein [Protofrankia]|uniref:Phospholipid/glycerol acyltransferase n=1 Tax=Candidatus Protofrankia datiscae TaxID=2716812 RepID=F8B0J8_9ACTN|nr:MULTISPECIES: lysophospholipid acyltransferase family protein [Protofrankia]AEH09752.1 phospholipid/glycerol acyltransferase [Candidatus Protofrankia datiscae]
MTAPGGRQRPAGIGLREMARGWRWASRPPVPASARPYQPAPRAREFPTSWARTPAMRAARVAALEFGMRPMLDANLSLSVAGLDAIEGLRTPAVFVSNHSSHLDAPLLLCALPRDIRDHTAVAAAADYFFDSWWRGLGTAFLFATVPIERRGGAPSSAPADLLAGGWNLVIFPEGTRSKDGQLARFRFGAAHLAITCGVPVVPVGIRGSFGAMPRGRAWTVPGRPGVSVRFGRPLYPADSDLRSFTGRIFAEVSRLIDEDATSWWDSLRAARERPAVPARAARSARKARWRQVWEATEPVGTAGAVSPWQAAARRGSAGVTGLSGSQGLTAATGASRESREPDGSGGAGGTDVGGADAAGDATGTSTPAG